MSRKFRRVCLQLTVDMASDISELHQEGVEKGLHDHLMVIHKSSLKRVPDSPLPVFEAKEQSTEKKIDQLPVCEKKSVRKFSSYVEIKHTNKTLYLNKTTTMWLLQEGERVSSDRLFRVRSKQPFSTDASTQKKSVATTTPTVCSALEVGEICVLIIDSKVEDGPSSTVCLLSRKNKENTAIPWKQCYHFRIKKGYGSVLYMVRTDISSTAICRMKDMPTFQCSLMFVLFRMGALTVFNRPQIA